MDLQMHQFPQLQTLFDSLCHHPNDLMNQHLLFPGVFLVKYTSASQQAVLVVVDEGIHVAVHVR